MIDYDPHDWRSHFFDIRGSLLNQIVLRISLCVSWAAAVTVIDHVVQYDLGIDPIAHSLVGVALGLLLVFRTNSSYDRFWEGRKLWGSIINDTRNLARLANVTLAGDAELLRRVVVWTMAFPVASMHVLRDQTGLGKFANQLPTNDVRRVMASNHCALAVARQITDLFRTALERKLVTDIVFVALDNNVQLLVQYLGACERIHRTPLPFAYVVHLRRAVLLYCYTLPFALVNAFGWWTLLATMFLTYLFFGIEEIGVEIEDPFGDDDNDLPLERFCQVIEMNLSEYTGSGPSPEKASINGHDIVTIAPSTNASA